MARKIDILAKLDQVLLAVSGMLVLFLSILMFIGVILRYLLKTSIGELQIAIRFSIAWLIFLGGASAFIRNKHLSLDLLRIGESYGRWRRIVQVLRMFIHFLVIGILLQVSFESFKDSLKRLEPINRSITQGYFYAPFLVGILLLLLILIVKIIRSMTDKET